MIYIKNGHKNDMYFVCKDTPTKEDMNHYDILKIFFKKYNAEKYIKDKR